MLCAVTRVSSLSGKPIFEAVFIALIVPEKQSATLFLQLRDIYMQKPIAEHSRQCHLVAFKSLFCSVLQSVCHSPKRSMQRRVHIDKKERKIN